MSNGRRSTPIHADKHLLIFVRLLSRPDFSHSKSARGIVPGIDGPEKGDSPLFPQGAWWVKYIGALFRVALGWCALDWLRGGLCLCAPFRPASFLP
jgi:hypothetical protein